MLSDDRRRHRGWSTPVDPAGGRTGDAAAWRALATTVCCHHAGVLQDWPAGSTEPAGTPGSGGHGPSGHGPTEHGSSGHGPGSPDVDTVLDVALSAGEEVLGAGAASADAAATIAAVAYAGGLDRVQVDATLTSLVVACEPVRGTRSVSRTAVVHGRQLDYTRLTRVHRILADLTTGLVSVAVAGRRIDRVRTYPYPYGQRTADAGQAALAGSVALSLGGSFLGAALGVAVTYLVLVVHRRTTSQGLPAFFGNAVSAATVTATATAASTAGLPILSSLVVAGGIVALLPSVALLSAVQDALAGYYVTAAGRLTEVLVLATGIAAGVALPLAAVTGLGVELRDVTADPPTAPVWSRLLGGALSSLFFLVSVWAPARLLWVAAGIGLGATTTMLGLGSLGVDGVPAVGLTAVLVGTTAVVVSGRHGVPPLVLAVAGFMPLLPGLAIYRGMLEVSRGNTELGVVTVLAAVGAATALASGVILGDVAATRLRRLRRLSLDLSREAGRRLDVLTRQPEQRSRAGSRSRALAVRLVGPSVRAARQTGERHRHRRHTQPAAGRAAGEAPATDRLPPPQRTGPPRGTGTARARHGTVADDSPDTDTGTGAGTGAGAGQRGTPRGR